MTNATFLWDNLWDESTLTASSQNPLFPAINTQHRWHTRVWRSATGAGTLTESIVADLGSAQAVQAFALKNHNFSSSAVVKIQANTSDSWTGTLPVDVTLTLNSDIMTYFWSAAQTYQYWRLYIVDSAPLTTYLKVGRVFLGPYFSPTVNLNKTYGKGYNDPSDIMESDGGQISTSQKTRYKDMSMAFEYITPADLASFEEMFESRGFGLPFFFTRDRALGNTTTMYVRMPSKPQTTHIERDQIYSVSLEIEELR